MIKIIVGALFGDEGKGQMVHNYCNSFFNSKPLVVRFSGGQQVGHTVVSGTDKHVFSNFGSGTFAGCPTYWSEYCTVDPAAAKLEREDLGFTPEIIYNPLCEVTTPFDIALQWMDVTNKEHGTVGTGFKTTLDRVKAGYHLQVIDCLNIDIFRAKVKAINENYWSKFIKSGLIEVSKLERWIYDTWYYFTTASINRLANLRYSNYIFEGSQGTLLDQTHGIMPYCTPSNTTIQNAISIIESIPQLKIQPIEAHLVCRPYITRHGNGPLVTRRDITNVENPHETNKFNEFQKSFRAAKFDRYLLEHSIRCNKLYIPSDLSVDLSLDVTQYDLFTSESEELFKRIYYDLECFNTMTFWNFEKAIKHFN